LNQDVLLKEMELGCALCHRMSVVLTYTDINPPDLNWPGCALCHQMSVVLTYADI